MSIWTLIVIAAILVGIGAFIIWRRRAGANAAADASVGNAIRKAETVATDDLHALQTFFKAAAGEAKVFRFKEWLPHEPAIPPGAMQPSAIPPAVTLKSNPATVAAAPSTTGQMTMTTAEQVAAIDAAIANLQHQRAILTAPAADPTKTPPAEPAPAPKWPHIITIDGINIMADADINPAWKATQMAKIIAGAYSGANGGALTDHYVWDPSNGTKLGKPVRSPAGFPLFYAIAGNVAVGTPSVLYGELSFNSDAEVAEYIARTTAGVDPVAQQAAWDASIARLAGQTAPAPAAGDEVPIA